MNELLLSYGNKYNEILGKTCLGEDDIASSAVLFKPESIKSGNPVPKRLDVYCIVAGLPLPEAITNYLQSIKLTISSILGDIPHYLVEDGNHGIELAVLKWPNETLQSNLVQDCVGFFDRHPFAVITCETYGIQVHSDGCIILKSVDKEGGFRALRKSLLAEVGSMPSRQSSWVHIPIGRILGPVPSEVLEQLKCFCDQTSLQENLRFKISEFKLIHERQWYQVDRITLDSFVSRTS